MLPEIVHHILLKRKIQSQVRVNNMKLRKLKYEDIDGMLEWMHDPKVNYGFRFDAEAMQYEDVKKFIENSWNLFYNGETYHYAIVSDANEYLGTISLKDIRYGDGTAEYAISLRSCVHGKGIGTWATMEILRIAFEELGLNRVYLNVLSDNQAAIRLYEKCGFYYEGEFREHLNIRGQIKSLKWFAMLKEDYRNRR